MKPAETIKLLKEWEAIHSRLRQVDRDLYAVVGQQPESKLNTIMWDTFNSYTKTLSLLLEDQHEWLDWYIWENGAGESKLSARVGRDKPMIIVDSIEKLAMLVGEGPT